MNMFFVLLKRILRNYEKNQMNSGPSNSKGIFDFYHCDVLGFIQ